MLQTRSEQLFCELMEADPMVRWDLLRLWEDRQSALGSEVRRMLQRLEEPEGDEPAIPPAT